MKKFGLIQPGRIGDIIILLPAMKYMNEMGYKIYWPIYDTYMWMFQDIVKYIKFIPVKNNVWTAVNESYHLLKDICRVDIIVDVAATFPGSVCTDEYVRSGDGYGENFDVFKYRLLYIPIDEKWKLNRCIIRNHEQEHELYKKYAPEGKYVLLNNRSSQGEVDIPLDNQLPIVHVNENHNIFDWLELLERAELIALVDSSMMNIVEQMNLPNRKILKRKNDGRLPMIKNKWQII
jgi:hypothetical protein